MANDIFVVSIPNWEKHNGSKKKNHRYILLEVRFFEDGKVTQLKQIEALLYLKCLTIAGDLLSNRFEVHAGMMPKRWRIDDKLLENCLNSLQQIQLVTYEKKSSLIIQKKRIQKKRREENSAEPSNLVPLTPSVSKAISIKISENHEVEVPRVLIGSWADTYPKEFLDLEIKKARSWLLANPHKSPKTNFGRFFNSWFNRAWEDYRKTLKSNPTQITVDDLNDLLGAQ